MKDRLLKFLNREQISSARFAENIGVQPSSISHILSGRNKPGFDFILKILTNYPALSADWLITGKGTMLKQEYIQGDLFPESPLDQVKYEDSYTDTNVNKEQDKSSYKSEFNADDQVTNVISDRNVEKIIILYSDKSFSEYSPA